MGEASTLALLRTCVRTLTLIIPAAPAKGLVNFDHISTNLCTIAQRYHTTKGNSGLREQRTLERRDSGL
jgi:hypothetical protein